MTTRPDMTGWRLAFHVKLPEAVKTLNQWQRMNRWERQKYERDLYLLVRAAVSEPPRQPANPARIHIVRGNPPPRPDHDNLVGGLKPLMDVLCCPRLRKAGWGFIVDDSPQFLDSYTAESVATSRGTAFTEIEVWARTDGAVRAAA